MTDENDGQVLTWISNHQDHDDDKHESNDKECPETEAVFSTNGDPTLGGLKNVRLTGIMTGRYSRIRTITIQGTSIYLFLEC